MNFNFSKDGTICVREVPEEPLRVVSVFTHQWKRAKWNHIPHFKLFYLVVLKLYALQYENKLVHFCRGGIKQTSGQSPIFWEK